MTTQTRIAMPNIHIPYTWDYCTSIPLDDLSDYLTEEEYDKYKNKFLSVDLTLTYENHSGDDDTGYPPSFDFLNWESSTLYPEPITKAIDKHLADFEQRYSDKAYEKLCDFIDYQKYGDY